MDFVDFTCVTELERITAKLIKNELKFTFKGVQFELKKVESELTGNEFINGLPNYQFNDHNSPARWFNCGVYWLLLCSDESRIVSEASARLLLSAVLMAGFTEELPVFMAVGDGEWRGFKLLEQEGIEFYEAAPKSSSNSNNLISTFQLHESRISGTQAISYPKQMGYFDDFCPIERVTIEAFWPKLRSENDSVAGLSLETAPIWSVSCALRLEEKRPPMRAAMQRVLLNGHLRELCTGEAVPLTRVPIFGALNDSAEVAAYRRGLDASEQEVIKIIAAIYANEVKRMEADGWMGGLGPVVWQNMRFTRITEKLALVWRYFLKLLERKWEQLEVVKFSAIEAKTDFNLQLQLFNWCIEREKSWQESIEEAGFRADELLPKLPHFSFSASVDLNEALLEQSATIESKIAEFSNEKGTETVVEDLPCPELVPQRIESLKHEFEFGEVWIPLTLNCQPPPPNLPLPQSAPLAGDVVALAQLKSDMSAFKAANAELVEASAEDAFTAFLLWHSPNDVEKDQETGAPVVSSRMLDPNGQWQQLWKECTPEPLSPATFKSHVSFNHRSLAGQLLSDWSSKLTAQMLLESSVPEIVQIVIKKQGELLKLLGKEVPDLKELCAQVPFPLDKLTEKLDAQERLICEEIALRQLKLRNEERWLLVDETERKLLLEIGAFECRRQEVVGADWYWRKDRSDGEFFAQKRTIKL